jgi:hypothetical protein
MWNEALGWTCILLGMLAGAVAGMRFQAEDWLGGYGSHRRRLLRLGHVALIALGMLNVLFVHGLERVALGEAALGLAAAALAIGAVSMPACCAWAAFRSRSALVFALPVTCLTLGVGLTAWGLGARILEVS